MSFPINVYISNSRKDEVWSTRIETHLGPIERIGKIRIWKDTKISTGDSWNDSILNAIDTADLAILIVSPDFLNSGWIMEREFVRLHRRYKDGALAIIPIIVRPSVWKVVGLLNEFQVFPKDGKPLSLLSEPEIELELSKIATEIFYKADQLGETRRIDYVMSPESRPKNIEDNIFYQAEQVLKSDENDNGGMEGHDLK